ncbi:MAG: HAMP domain-containing sensor histidine kinase [Balneola sp.]
MQKKWTIYSFLGIMMVALVTLAVLQYHWLGSVSDAEKKRLQENLDASTENFVSDLNRDLSSLNQAFKIQISNNNEVQIEGLLEKSYLNWLSNTEYPQLIDSLFFVQDVYGNDPVVNLFATDPVRLTTIEKPKHLAQWIDKQNSTKKHASSSIDLLRSPDFGEPTLIAVPVQLLDLITIENENSGKNMQVSLNIDQGDDVVLLQLDDNVIKNQIIPEIAKTYFSDSYKDQYNLSIVKEEADEDKMESIYFTTSEDDVIPNPDFKKKLRNFDFTSVFVIQSENNISDMNPLFKNLEAFPGKLQSIKIENESSAKGFAMSSESSQMRFRSATKDSVFTVKKDTTINTSFSADFTTASWQFWLSFKEGSLDSFVNKAKNRNLIISFGILLILGFCVGMIVLFSKRSQDLAEKQMLFVAGVSHELRTPLTVIRSAAENLNEGVVQTEERKKEYARLMLKEGRRLSDMVDQIMEFSGIQSGKKIYQFSDFEIKDFIEEVNSECRTLLEEQGMTLEYSIHASTGSIFADRDALFLAVGNLIQNAIKFSNGSKLISLKVDDVEFRSKNAIRFQIIDHGIGIPEEEQKQIFEPFFRGKKSVEDQVKGNGIGLSLVQKVAKAHHGDIQLKSKQDHGSIFSLIIPQTGNI